MSTKAITPRLADRLCSLAESQLQTQISRSGALDASALGVMAIDAAVAAIAFATRGTYDLWIIALALLGLSLGVAVRILLGPGAKQNGPLVADMLDARTGNDDEIIEEGLLKELARETLANERALARKDPLIAWAVALQMLAIALELAGVQ
jgi:glucose-6-phosphate-specific signal transduction histidine kinase